MTRSLTSLTELAAAADQCVRCGLCLPHCPTYGVLHEEADSPRGRIALIQGFAEGKLTLSTQLVEHLDRCLLCQACEYVCPAKVPYHELMVGARQQIAESDYARKPADGRIARLLEGAENGKVPSWLRLGYQSSGLQWLVRHTRMLPTALARAEGYLPAPTRPLEGRERYPAAGPEVGRVGLFAGCMGPDFDARTLRAAIRLLNAYGFTVIMPPGHHCCGALHLHQGDIETARDRANESLSAFSGLGLDAVVTASSACSAALADAALSGGQVSPFMEVCRFLADRMRSDSASGRRVRFRPLNEIVAVHTPCSQAHAFGDRSSVTDMLSLIPGIRLRMLATGKAGSVRCCGGAGRYMFDQPVLADRIREQTLAEIADTEAPIVATTNIGCALHIGKGLRESGSARQVIHPITLLAGQLDDGGNG